MKLLSVMRFDVASSDGLQVPARVYTGHFSLSPDISTRNRGAIHKTFTGLMKIIYPHGEAEAEERPVHSGVPPGAEPVGASLRGRIEMEPAE